MVGFGKFQENEFVQMLTINSVLEKEDILGFFKTLESFISTHVVNLSAS